MENKSDVEDGVYNYDVALMMDLFNANLYFEDETNFNDITPFDPLPEVLESILSFIYLEDLRLMKQVSHLWRTESNRQLLKRARVRLIELEKLVSYNQVYRSQSFPQQLQQLTLTDHHNYRAIQLFPHKSYKIKLASPHDIMLQESDREKLQEYKLHLDTFFATFGQFHVKDLYIDVHQPSENALRTMLQVQSPQLQILILKSPPSDRAYIEDKVHEQILIVHEEVVEVVHQIVHDNDNDEENNPVDNVVIDNEIELVKVKRYTPYNESSVLEPMEKLFLPHLEELYIESFKGQIQALNLKRFLKFIFGSAVNLRKIYISSGGNVLTRGEERILLDAILESNEERELRKLMYMYFPAKFVLSESDVILLKKKLPPNLRRIRLTFQSNVQAESICNLILERFYFGLEHLQLTFSQNMARPNIVFPSRLVSQIFVNLRLLKLKGYRGSLSFVTSLPKLEMLVVNGISEDFSGNLFFDPLDLQEPCSSTSARNTNMIKIFESDTQISNINLQSLSSLSSSIQHLTLSYLDDEGLKIIFKNLPLIKTLKLSRGSFTDSGLTGVPQQFCTELMVNDSYLDVLNPSYFRSSLYIGSLPCLSNLQLESDRIGDLSISFGLTSCYKLKHLTLASPKITSVGISLLDNVIDQSLMESINLRKCSTHLGFDVEYLQKRNDHIYILEPWNNTQDLEADNPHNIELNPPEPELEPELEPEHDPNAHVHVEPFNIVQVPENVPEHVWEFDDSDSD